MKISVIIPAKNEAADESGCLSMKKATGVLTTTVGRFTNMSMLLFSAAVIIFLIGLVSAQITALNHKGTGS